MEQNNMMIENKHTTVLNIKPYLKKIMLTKLDENTYWTYINVPEGRKKSDVKSAIRTFIENNLDDFIQLCGEVLPYFSQQDSESIGSAHPTKNAVKFMELFSYLEEKGFPGPKQFNKPVNFWSGTIAQHKALSLSEHLSDSKIPVISAMFDVCGSILRVQQKYDDYISLLTSAVARIFASYAFDEANVYISSEKQLEHPGLTVSNIFWLAELPTLMRLYDRKKITDIIIHNYNAKQHTWEPGISLFSESGLATPIRRKYIHPLDDASLSDRFKRVSMSDESRKHWIKSEPRPSITYGALKRIAHEWAERTKKNKINKIQINSLTLKPI